MKLSNKAAAVCFLALSATTLAQAQVQESALDHMLQRPRVTKQFDHKRPFDHLFIDAGAGPNLLGRKHPQIGAEGIFNIGDWITPEHGMRLSFTGGATRTDQGKTTIAGIGLDYMLNITALSQRGTHYSPRPFEVYGIAGADFALSRRQGNNAHGLGAHLGLRGQVALSPFTYFYVEPRLSVMQDDVSQMASWHGYRPSASASLGLGYRLPEQRLQNEENENEGKKWTDGMFMSLMGGPLFFANSNPSSWKHNAGGRLTASLGKWFGSYNGVRLSLNATTFKQQGNHRVKAAGGQVDYLLNLHNAFGGINPDRRFWVNGVAGVSFNRSSDATDGQHSTFGLGGGFQGNVRLSRNVDFLIEPRLDAYHGNYAPHLVTYGEWDLTASLLAGFSYTYHDNKATRSSSDPFEQNVWHDHMFAEMGLGGNVPVTRSSALHPFEYLRPQAYAAVGKWFTPIHGARLWGQVAQTEYQDPDKRYKHVEWGLDYLFNFTNAFYGYRAYRPFEFSGGLGLNMSRREKRSKLFVGGNASLRGTWNVNPFLGIFVEPRLQAYGKDYLPSSFVFNNVDLVASASAGVQFNMQGFDRARAYERMNEDGQGLRRSISVAGGLGVPANQLRSRSHYSPMGRMSYTQWYTPLSAWRVNLQGMVRGAVNNSRLGQATVGVDWMTDLTAQTYGYDISRPLSIRAFAGVGLGADIGGGRSYFAPELRAGGQMSIRLNDTWHIFAEPQVAYEFSKRYKNSSRLGRVMPQMLVGLDYSLEHHAANGDLKGTPDKPHFVSFGLGTGVYSANFSEMSPFGRKMTFATDVAYGQWMNHLSGFHIGLSNTVAQRHGKGNESITSLRADYMMNLSSALSGSPSDDHLFQLTGLVGASLEFSSRKGRNTQVVPGLQAAMQAGLRVTPQVEIYLEPSATMFSSHIAKGGTGHPIDGELRLSLGTKYHF